MFNMVKHLLFFSKQFEDFWASSLWVSGVLVLEFGPIPSWYRFPAAEEFVFVFDVFFCLMMHQMLSIGKRSGLQAGQFSTRTILLRSHAVVLAAVCGFALSCWNTRHLEGSICCSKTFIYPSAYIVPSKTCKLPKTYAHMLPHTIRDAGFWTERWWHAGSSPSSLARRTWRPWFHTRCVNRTGLDN